MLNFVCATVFSITLMQTFYNLYNVLFRWNSIEQQYSTTVSHCDFFISIFHVDDSSDRNMCMNNTINKYLRLGPGSKDPR